MSQARYWNVERQTDDERYRGVEIEDIDGDCELDPSHRIQGAAGERVLLYTDRWLPLEELDVITRALNTMPEYQVLREDKAQEVPDVDLRYSQQQAQ